VEEAVWRCKKCRLDRSFGTCASQSRINASTGVIGGQYRGLRCLLDGIAKRVRAERPGPAKHFQDQEIDMQYGDQRRQQVGDPDHVVLAPKPTVGIRVDASMFVVRSAMAYEYFR
jgi:hypothetical protein